MLRRQLAELGDPEQPHGTADLFGQDLDHPVHAGFAAAISPYR